MTKKNAILESLLKDLSIYYTNDKQATDYVDDKLNTTDDVETFLIKHNVEIDYKAPNQKSVLENLKTIIDDEK